MKTAIFGGTGFIGQYVVEELVSRGHHPVLLVRPGSEHKVPLTDQCELVTGHLSDEKDIEKTLRGCSAALYLTGIIREFPRKAISFEELHFLAAVRVMQLCLREGIDRFILMSANGVRPDGTKYQRSKYRAEVHLRSSKLAWTIFRPSVVFGDPKGRMEFCTMIRNQIVSPPLPAPLFYRGCIPKDAGRFLLSPVHVRDVAACIAQALTREDCVGKIFHLGGPSSIEWRTLVSLVSQAAGKRKIMVPVPACGVTALAFFFENCPWFPVTADQIHMLLEGNTCDSRSVFEWFGIDPLQFTVQNLEYLRQ